MAELADAYNDNNVLFPLLRQLGWDDLVNIGYFTLPTLPAFLAGTALFQRALVRRSLALLDHAPGHRVLDAACGRGYTTAQLADAGCHTLGIDLQPQQIDFARRRFGNRPRATFAVGDVTCLPRRAEGVSLDSGSIDRIHCLEAAFHFGPAGRRGFLTESYRLLRPGGRLVLVDLTWPHAARQTLPDLDTQRLVRDAWQFEQFETLERYIDYATAAGFDVHPPVDWTRPVLRRSARLIGLAGLLASSDIGRHVYRWRWPALAGLTHQQWQEIAVLARAHQVIGRVGGYHALICDKPR
ncbi:class I SAM-dependent methyltransferase [Streptomyces sp. GLT-R25]